MNRRWRERTAILVATVIAAGCAREDPPGVDALVVQTDLAFGIAEADEPSSPPPNVLTPLTPVAGDVEMAFTPPTLPPTEPVPECRTAGLTDFPEEPAARNVADDRRPVTGDFRWVRAGEVRDVRFANVPISVDGFELRHVRDVVERTGDIDATTGEERAAFEYVTEQQDLTTGATVVRTWRVRTGAVTASPADLIVQPTLPDGSPPPTTRGGEPDRGVSLVRQITTADDGTESVFEPATPLLVLPLPVRPGETFSSTAVDPTTFQSMSFNASVGVPERVDACGDVIEGWPVAGQLQFVGPGGEAVTFAYQAVIAPQLGGIIAAETIEQGVEGGPGMNVSWRLGELPS